MLKILEALEIRKYLPQGSRAAGQGKRPPSPARADAIDILVDVRVLFRVPIDRIGEPSEDASLVLGLGYLCEIAVDGGLGGGEGDALDDGDGLHGVFLLVCFLSLILL